jgi:hypothetical protein
MVGRTTRFIREGLSFRPDTLQGMAEIGKEKLKTTPEKFWETLPKYNEMAQKGEDKEFGKNPKNLKAVEKPPFSVNPIRAAIHHTMDGIREGGLARGSWTGTQESFLTSLLPGKRRWTGRWFKSNFSGG